MADLYGTYDKRIKLTAVYTDNITATLTWFPVTVFLTSTQGEEVFVELDEDTDFDKCAFTKSDGVTELYADCELYDVSEEVAIYHVSLDGWELSHTANTDFYMYYDDDASANTSKISMSGGTAAQSVYDANFKAVYHMNDIADANIEYDTKYEAAVEPDSDGWTLVETDYSSSDGDILTIDTSANDNLLCSYRKTPDVDFDGGFYLKTRIKASTDMNTQDDYLYFAILDGTQNERILFGISDAGFYSTSSVGSFNWTALDTTTDYVVYELYVKATTYWLYADGVLKDTDLIHTQSGSDLVQFGDISPGIMCKAEIDYVYYALDIGWNPAITDIVDSTSNANTGTKGAVGEPTQTALKVGYGQDFDGGDLITIGDAATLDMDKLTVSFIMKTATEAGIGVIGKRDDWNDENSWNFYKGTNTMRFQVSTDGSTTTAITSSSTVDDNAIYHIAGVADGTDLKIYIDGASDQTPVGFANNVYTGTADVTLGKLLPTTFYTGLLDEVRISDTDRAAAWNKATYESLWDSLLTYGNEETSGAVVDNAIFFGCNF